MARSDIGDEAGADLSIDGTTGQPERASASFCMKDYAGAIPVETLRGHFESVVAGTPAFAVLSLRSRQTDGTFRGYVDAATDKLWVGFAIGMRCAQRLGWRP